MDKTALALLVRVDWGTTGRIIERVVADRLDPNRLQHLFQVGVERRGIHLLPGRGLSPHRYRRTPP